MDRDVALQITTKLNAVKTALQSIATNTTPTAASRSVPEENQRSAPAEDPEEPEAPAEEPETRTKK